VAKSEHYIDNNRLYDELVTYQNACKGCTLENRPPVPDYLGDCFLQIAKNLSHKPNFLGYSYRDEMIMDGVENCLLYLHNFDPTKGKNPFSYFTTIIFYAFLRRIGKEKKHQYTKYKVAEQQYHAGVDVVVPLDSSYSPQMRPPTIDYDNVQEFIKNYETTTAKQRANKRERKKVESPFDDTEDIPVLDE
jgi:hypothetical protein